MIAMPVSQQGLVHRGFLISQHRLEILSPCLFALAAVDEDTLMAPPNEVCVCACAIKRSERVIP